MKKLKFLKNPLVVIASIVLGATMGVTLPGVSQLLAPFGNMYLHLLQMLVIPILFTAILSSVGRLMGKTSGTFIKKIFFYFSLTIILTSGFGIIMGIVGQPGMNLSQESKNTLGAYVQSSTFDDTKIMEVEIFTENKEEEVKENPIINFITTIVPNNIFKSLYSGVAMEVVFFTVLLGISIGLIRTDESDMIIKISSSFFLSLQRIMNITIYFLPFGLVLLVADQVRSVGFGLIYPMLKLILIFYISGLILLIFNTVSIKMKSQTSFKETFKALNEAMMISFFARNSLAAIPAAVTGLSEGLRYERSNCNLLIPLGITLGRYGNILYFAITSMFVLQLYDVNYGISELIIVFIGSIFAGTATSGATGFATLPLIGIILTPLGIPLEVVILLLFAIDALVDPLRTLLIVHCNITSAALISDRYDSSKMEEANKRKKNFIEVEI